MKKKTDWQCSNLGKSPKGMADQKNQKQQTNKNQHKAKKPTTTNRDHLTQRKEELQVA